MKISIIAPGDRYDSYTCRLLKAILEKEGHAVDLIYINILRQFSKQKWTDSLERELLEMVRGSEVVCFNVFTFNYLFTARLSDFIRQFAWPFIIWGGPHAMAKPEECLGHADAVFIGEGDKSLPEIIRRGRLGNFSDIPNIAYMKNGVVYKNHIEQFTDFESLPFSDMGFKNQYFIKNGRFQPLSIDDYQDYEFITVWNRGCPHHCTFCLNSGPNKVRFNNHRSLDNVIAELVAAKKQLGDHIKKIMFYDDDFFATPLQKIIEFKEKYTASIGLPLHFVNASAALFTEEKLVQLREAGIEGIIVGVQSISENGTKTYRNKATRENIRNISETMMKYPDLTLILHLILGNPFETEDDIAENILFLNSLPKIDILAHFQLTIYPGTVLYEMVRNSPYKGRADEGYSTTHYTWRPKLELWNYLCHKYLGQKQKLPDWIVTLITDRQYALLRALLQPKAKRLYGLAINRLRGAAYG
jgi:radical SAM superfamily enzyme YgiQ (UPF0313 family)